MITEKLFNSMWIDVCKIPISRTVVYSSKNYLSFFPVVLLVSYVDMSQSRNQGDISGNCHDMLIGVLLLAPNFRSRRFRRAQKCLPT